MKYIAILTAYGFCGFIQRGWFDVYGLLTVALLLIPVAICDYKAKQRYKTTVSYNTKVESRNDKHWVSTKGV